MSKVLFINGPFHGHINPTLALAEELVKRGEEITYFSSEEFREKIEKTGAGFKNYGKIPSISIESEKLGPQVFIELVDGLIRFGDKLISNILPQLEAEKYNYVIHDSMLGCGNIIAKILNIPSVSSFAGYAVAHLPKLDDASLTNIPKLKEYFIIKNKLKDTYGIEISNIMDVPNLKGDLNLVWTSSYFTAGFESFDQSFKFVGPPDYGRNEDMDFPFQELLGKKVIYISIGTANFNNADTKRLYDIFFRAFENSDVVVVMTAYNIDVTNYNIPQNYIVRNYVPQSKILKYTSVAVSHGGMNSTSDILLNSIPMVLVPFKGDQIVIASRVAELGAGINLQKGLLTAENFKDAVEKVLSENCYAENARKISDSFITAGGTLRAVDEILKFKKDRNIP